jgi:enamine deaminase RidA (YjgF/YER057c/UK114 family)
MKSAAGLGAVGAIPLMSAAAEGGSRTKAPGGIRVGNLYFSGGIATSGADIKEQTQKVLELHKTNLEKMGSSLTNVIKVTVFLADVRNEKPAMNEVYAKYFPKDAPARSAFGVQFPDDATRVEIELVAYIP